MYRFFAALALCLTIAPALGAQGLYQPTVPPNHIFTSWPPSRAAADTRYWGRDSVAVVDVIRREVERWASRDTTVRVTNLQIYGDSATAVGRWGQSRASYSAGRFRLDRKNARWTLRPWTSSDTATFTIIRSHGH